MEMTPKEKAIIAAKALDEILGLRDLFVETKCLLKAYSHAMHLLGCEGNFAQDYNRDIPDVDKERVTAAMKALGEI
mgnify:CR=1 FL=1